MVIMIISLNFAKIIYKLTGALNDINWCVLDIDIKLHQALMCLI